MTSLGTCRLVMPRSESTMARSGPASRPRSMAALISAPSSSESRPERMAPRPLEADRPASASWTPYFSKTSGRNVSTAWPKRIGSETFIIVALRWTENSTSSSLARCDLHGEELAQRGDAHEGRVDHLAGLHGHALAQDRPRPPARRRARCVRKPLLSITCDCSLERKSSLGHVRDAGLGVAAPLAHRVGVLAGVALHRRRGAAIGVALAQHGVDGAALDLVVAGADVALLVGLGVAGVVGQVVALVLQLLDRGLELRHRGADVRQLDDVGLGRLGQLAELGRARRRASARRSAGRRTAR